MILLIAFSVLFSYVSCNLYFPLGPSIRESENHDGKVYFITRFDKTVSVEKPLAGVSVSTGNNPISIHDIWKPIFTPFKMPSKSKKQEEEDAKEDQKEAEKLKKGLEEFNKEYQETKKPPFGE